MDGRKNFKIEYKKINGIAENLIAYNINTAKTESADEAIHILEKRYAAENDLMIAVSRGLINKAEIIINSTAIEAVFEFRVDDPVRNTRNYLIILNTLLRKAAEKGNVHPLYIDKMSSYFAAKIEMLTETGQTVYMIKEMIKNYCRLVQKHSAKGYSLLVQKVITRIDADPSADLGLKAQAKILNINPSYLSALFKKETEITLTDYLNTKRAEYTAYLLRSTNYQIQTIAQKCGILDVNYFTKLFKKYENKTPGEYRKIMKNK